MSWKSWLYRWIIWYRSFDSVVWVISRVFQWLSTLILLAFKLSCGSFLSYMVCFFIAYWAEVYSDTREISKVAPFAKRVTTDSCSSFPQKKPMLEIWHKIFHTICLSWITSKLLGQALQYNLIENKCIFYHLSAITLPLKTLRVLDFLRPKCPTLHK